MSRLIDNMSNSRVNLTQSRRPWFTLRKERMELLRAASDADALRRRSRSANVHEFWHDASASRRPENGGVACALYAGENTL